VVYMASGDILRHREPPNKAKPTNGGAAPKA